MKSINQMRNASVQSMRKSFLGESCMHITFIKLYLICTIYSHSQQHGHCSITGMKNKPSYENVSTLRKAASEYEKSDVYIFYDTLIQSVVGNKIWKKEKSESLISQEITTSQEATALWILKNYEDKWNNSSGTQAARFTGSKRGNKVYNGWSHEGIAEYNSICVHVKQDRVEGLMYEEDFRAKQHREKTTNVDMQNNQGNQNSEEPICVVTPYVYNDLEEEEAPKLIESCGSQSTPTSSISHTGQTSLPPTHILYTGRDEGNNQFDEDQYIITEASQRAMI